MELLNPAHPPHQYPTRDPISGLSFRRQVDRPASTQFPEIAEETGSFGAGEKDSFCSSGKVVGKLPASQANGQVVSAYRRKEKVELKKLLENYLSVCGKLKVKTSILTLEADQVHKGIVELVNRHGIRNLIMGAIPENCVRMKKSSSKASFAARNAPCFCDIWFINKGKLVWTRDASEDPSSLPEVGQAAASAQMLRSNSLPHSKGDSLVHPENLHSKSSRSINFVATTQLTESEPAHMDVSLSPGLSTFATRYSSNYYQSLSCPSCTTGSECASSETRLSLDSYSKDEEESLCSQLREASMEAEASRNKALVESLKCQKLESEAMEAINKLKDFNSARAHKVELRKEAEEALRTTMQEQEKLIKEKEEVTRELQRTMRNVALLNSRAQEATRKHDEAAGELKLIQTSIATLQQEKQRIRQQKKEAVRWLECWRSRGQAGAATCNGFIGLVEDLPELAEFSLADVQTATCNFSESFKIGKGGHGCVYKGEMLGRTVAIKKLYPHNIQGQSEFQQEVNYLGQLYHPNLVKLIGYCLEDEHRLLVYEFMPRGSLENHLFRRGSYFQPLSWSLRLKVALGAAKGLAFLHSAETKVIYRDFKTSNILLDSNYNAKLSDFGLAKDGPADGKSHVSTRVMGTYGYAAPEYLATGHLTAKSDVYSFGVVLLEMLSGRRAVDKNRPSGEHNLVEWAKPYLANKRKVFRVLDNRLEGQYSMEGAYKAATLALRCLSTEAKFRPSMNEVVTALEKLQDSNESGSNQSNTSSTPRIRRRSADDAGRSAAAYPRPSASPLYA
ncbi:hypothetical protein CRYUN_Cryun02cG0189600 [Craigia yunnanensis]